MLIEENNAGRPFGGIGWAIRKNIKYHEIKFINDHILIIKLNNTTIIGVYLQCNYNTKDSYNQHLHDISQLEGILNMIDNRENIMLIGDFNSDPQRKSKFDALIRKLFEKYDLIMLKNKKSISNNEKIFTFTGNNNSSSNIDHIIINKEMSMLNPKFQIVDSIMNTSDHKSIHCQVNIPQIFELIKNHIITSNESSSNEHIKWDDNNHIKIYKKEIMTSLKDIKLLNITKVTKNDLNEHIKTIY